jgi:hypothetical protein
MSSDFSNGRLQEKKDYQNHGGTISMNRIRQQIQGAYSPIAAGREDMLLWLIFKTTREDKFLRSSLNTSRLL